MDITIPADGGRIPAYVATSSPPSPGIVLLTAIFGLEPAMRQIAERFAQRGYLVVVPNMFWRGDSDALARTGAERERALIRKQTMDVERLRKDIAATARYVAEMPECTGRVGAVGYCFGGRYSFFAAADAVVDVAVALHPTEIGESLSVEQAFDVPIDLHFGTADVHVPMSEVEEISTWLRDCAAACVYVYDGAQHSFGVSGTAGYDAKIAGLTEARAFETLDRYLAR